MDVPVVDAATASHLALVQPKHPQFICWRSALVRDLEILAGLVGGDWQIQTLLYSLFWGYVVNEDDNPRVWSARSELYDTAIWGNPTRIHLVRVEPNGNRCLQMVWGAGVHPKWLHR
jgi:hypothetical protein